MNNVNNMIDVFVCSTELNCSKTEVTANGSQCSRFITFKRNVSNRSVGNGEGVSKELTNFSFFNFARKLNYEDNGVRLKE